MSAPLEIILERTGSGDRPVSVSFAHIPARHAALLEPHWSREVTISDEDWAYLGKPKYITIRIENADVRR